MKYQSVIEIRKLCHKLPAQSTLLICLCATTMAAAEPVAPVWLNNDLGRDEIVLPGFAPVRMSGNRVELGAQRTYDWGSSLLPRAISSQGRALVGPMELVVRVAGADRQTSGAAIQILASTDHHVELKATSAVGADFAIEVHSRVEYDGVAIVDVTLSSATQGVLDSLDLRFSLPRIQGMRLMAFDPATVYHYSKKLFWPICFHGAYKNALGFVYPNASFWWFADDVNTSVLGDTPLTIVRCSDDMLRVSQPLLSKPQRIMSPLHFRFAFLATPVRDLGGSFRRDRIVAKLSAEEAEVGTINLWFPDATAHYALPYLDYPPGARERLPLADVKAYPGAAKNRSQVQSWRRMGIERLPYISLRAISPLDPVVNQFLEQWQVMPRLSTGAHSDAPYNAGFDRALLSHRGAGFSNYLLFRLNEVIDGLQVLGSAPPMRQMHLAYQQCGWKKFGRSLLSRNGHCATGFQISRHGLHLTHPEGAGAIS